MEMDLVLENGEVFYMGKLQRVNVGIENGKIVKVADKKLDGKERIDCTGKVVLPGLIDVHVHFRVPGFEHKEDWKTGSAAAAAGGVTTVFDMPNTKPPTILQGLLREKAEIAKRDSIVDFRLHFGMTERNINELIGLEGANSLKIYLSSRNKELYIGDAEKILEIFEAAKELDFVVCVHAEDGGEEELLIQNVLEIQKVVGNKVHIVHVSTKEGLEAVAEAKGRENGDAVTCEVCPHHLYLVEEDEDWLRELSAVDPPLRSWEDVNALWRGINNGTVDCIASDHAPHTREEKKDGLPGMPGVQTMLPLMLDVVNGEQRDKPKADLAIERLVELCCENPARIFGLEDKGEIKEGKDADFAIVDMNADSVIRNVGQKTKVGWTPFDGKKIKGVVEKTIVKGRVVYERK